MSYVYNPCQFKSFVFNYHVYRCAGATRNFEALKRAEEQAEREDRAHKEELENNPMKQLEVGGGGHLF